MKKLLQASIAALMLAHLAPALAVAADTAVDGKSTTDTKEPPEEEDMPDCD